MINIKKLSYFLDKKGINICAFSIFGLLFIFKPNTLLPTLILIFGIFLLIFESSLRSEWISNFKNPTFKWVTLPFIAWFLTSLFIALIHINEAGFIFPSNAFRIGIASVLLCFSISDNSKKFLILGLIVASIASFSWGLFEILEENVRAQGTTNNPIHFGNITALIALICLSLTLLESKLTTKTRLALLLSAFLSAFASAFSQTRSSALIIFCIIPLFLITKKNNFNKKIIYTISAIFIVIIALSFASTEFQRLLRVDHIFHEIRTNKQVNHEIITGNRYEMWHSAWMSFKEHPITGLGPDGFKNSLEKHILSGEINSTEIFNQPHNDILHAASSGGIIKLISYLSLLFFPFYFFYSQYKKNKSHENMMAWPIIGMQVVGAYFLFGLTNSNFDLQIYSTIYAILICILMKISLINPDARSPNTRKKY